MATYIYKFKETGNEIDIQYGMNEDPPKKLLNPKTNWNTVG